MLESILQVTGFLAIAAVVVAVALVAIAYFWLRGKWKKLKAFAAEAAVGDPPMTIELDEVPEAEATWKKSDDVVALEKELRSFDLVPGKCYDVDELMVNLQVWYAPDSETCVVVYHLTGAGVWTDIFLRYEDGSLTVSNAPHGGDLERPPERPAFFLKGQSFAEVAEKFFAEVDGTRSVVPIGPDNFVEEFETAYKEENLWRARNGGVSEDEIRKVMESGEEQLTNEKFGQAVVAVKLQELYKYQLSCIENLSNSTTMPVGEWQRHEDSMFIVSDLIHAGAFIEAMIDAEEFAPETADWMKEQVTAGESCRKIFDGIKARLPEGVELAHCGTVSEPLEADVYAFARVDQEAMVG